MRALIVPALAALVATATPGAAQTVINCYDADDLSVGSQYGAAQMTVQRDGRCSHGGVFSNVTIDQPPRNGRIEQTGSGLTYFPNPGFVGSDSYVFSGNSSGGGGRSYSRAGPTGRVSITVSVTVE